MVSTPGCPKHPRDDSKNITKHLHMLSKSWFTLWYARFCLGTFVGLVESYMLTTLCNCWLTMFDHQACHQPGYHDWAMHNVFPTFGGQTCPPRGAQGGGAPTWVGAWHAWGMKVWAVGGEDLPPWHANMCIHMWGIHGCHTRQGSQWGAHVMGDMCVNAPKLLGGLDYINDHMVGCGGSGMATQASHHVYMCVASLWTPCQAGRLMGRGCC